MPVILEIDAKSEVISHLLYAEIVTAEALLKSGMENADIVNIIESLVTLARQPAEVVHAFFVAGLKERTKVRFEFPASPPAAFAPTTTAAPPAPIYSPAVPSKKPPATPITSSPPVDEPPSVPAAPVDPHVAATAYIKAFATPDLQLQWVLRAQGSLDAKTAADIKAEAGLKNGCLLNENGPDAVERYAIMVAEHLLRMGLPLPKPLPPAPKRPVAKKNQEQNA